ncbi:dTDP-4-dehydrorhamnose reductase [Aquimarina sediminis]|uniref:dTDP-4-dehydrorhamnose reductase n=1 Tax=Aquimarina sediminis TaxID=2070536 RepID=UPI000C9FFD1A|nr:dTDP-4-dehydrorhamnose reductase [Aquimarina sediminis]
MNEKSEVKNVLVTGSNGQLGQCLQKIEENHSKIDLFFANSTMLDITNKDKLEQFFNDKRIDYIINCAAYTNVEQAEKEPELAFMVNAEGAKNLAQICKKHNSTLVHISTDYVFDGMKRSPYTEDDITNPLNEYGKSKLVGERYIEEILDKFYILRTSWLYSEFGNNFFKTILKKSNTEQELTIVTSETGTPTNANDLAEFILSLVKNNSQKYGIYHFSNLGEASWYDFAREILRVSGKLDSIILKKTDNYPTFAQRPNYSVLCKEKCLRSFNSDIENWKKSLQKNIKTFQKR